MRYKYYKYYYKIVQYSKYQFVIYPTVTIVQRLGIGSWMQEVRGSNPHCGVEGEREACAESTADRLNNSNTYNNNNNS